jgi:trehalose-6-phosphate synthase
MLGADLIGFQTHSFARHFRQTVSRILSVEATPKGILLPTSAQNLLDNAPFSPVEEERAALQRAWLHGHPPTALEKAEAEVDQTVVTTAADHNFIDVAVFPMGIDVKSLAKRRREKEVGEWVKSLKERYKGMKIIVARDKLDEVQVGNLDHNI